MQLTKFIEKNRSRREFLSFFGKISLVFAMPINFSASNKMTNKEEYVFINGWLLKKKDLNDI